MEHELWFTAILNKLCGEPLAALLARLGCPAANAVHPIPNYTAMEILAAIVIVAASLLLRRQLSVESPGTFQQSMESVVEFVRSMNEEVIGHDSLRYVGMVGTLGIFIMLCNVMGLVPTLGTATGHIEVTLGCAVAVFVYYNFQAIRHHGVFGYLKHLWGPVLLMGFLMFPIEVFGNVFRMLSLSVRLYANMFVGDVLESVFTGLIPVGVPAAFMALHLFVSALQAYIFMLLPAVYISLSTSSEH